MKQNISQIIIIIHLSLHSQIYNVHIHTYNMSELLRFCTFFINHNFYSEFISTRNTERTESHVILFRSFCRFFFLLFFTHVCMPWYVVFMFNFWMLLLNNVNNDTQTRIIYITSAVFFFSS